MATMNISIPDQMREWVEDQISTGLYANNSDYVRDLIRRDQIRNGKLQTLQQAVTAGLESGPGRELDLGALKAEARRRAGIEIE